MLVCLFCLFVVIFCVFVLDCENYSMAETTLEMASEVSLVTQFLSKQKKIS